MASRHRRRPSRKVQLIGGVTAVAATAGDAFAFAGSASAATVGAAYSKTSDWTTGYTGRYVISNSNSSSLSGWTLTFHLPAGTTISSLWNGTYTVSGQTVTVSPTSWNSSIAAGGTVDIGPTGAAAWSAIAVTPMIGVNDVSSEIFTVSGATQLVTFTKTKHLARLPMWSATRDEQCAADTQTWADATCSSVLQSTGDFSKALAGYTG